MLLTVVHLWLLAAAHVHHHAHATTRPSATATHQAPTTAPVQTASAR